MTTLTETIRELSAAIERIDAAKVAVCKDDQSRQAHSNQRIDLAVAMLIFEQLAYDHMPALLDAAERAERYEKELQNCDYHADILKTVTHSRGYSREEIALAIHNCITAGADAGKALTPQQPDGDHVQS